MNKKFLDILTMIVLGLAAVVFIYVLVQTIGLNSQVISIARL